MRLRAWYVESFHVSISWKITSSEVVSPSIRSYVQCLISIKYSVINSLEHEKDERLLSLFDDISQNSGPVFFGRYDVRCTTIEDLKSRKNYSILEFNGAGAEPHHVYGNGNSLIQAIRILLFHWNILFRISIANHKLGIPYWPFRKGLEHVRHAGKHIEMLRALEKEAGVADEQSDNAPSIAARPILQTHSNL